MIMKDFEYLFTGCVLVTKNEQIFSNVYEAYKGKWKNDCTFDEFYDFTIRLDFKQMKVYVYVSESDGIVFEELLANLKSLSNRRFMSEYDHCDWSVLRKDYQVSFECEENISFHSSDSGLFMEVKEDGKIILRRSIYYEEKEKKQLYQVIAPVIIDVEKIFGPDFEQSDNKMLQMEFQKKIDADYSKVIEENTRKAESGTA